MSRHASRAFSSRFAIFAIIAVLLTTGLVQWSTASVPSTQAAPPPADQLGKLVMKMSSPNGLVINEVYDSQSGSNEYFELYNTSSITLTLGTYVIYNRDSSLPLNILSNQQIGAQSFRVIGPAQLNNNWFTGATGLERIDFLGLVNTSPSDTIIDVVNWGGAPNPNWPNYDRFAANFFSANIPLLPAADGTRSLQRWPDGLDSDAGTDFAQIFSSPGNFSCGDPFEDNNTRGTARDQAVGTSALHRICPAQDQDWTAVRGASTSNSYQFFAQAQGNQVDLTMRVYDSSGVFIVENNDPGSRDASIAFRPPSNGDYFVQILNSLGTGNIGPPFLYSLTITAQTITPTSTVSPTPATTTPTAIPCQDPFEPDNTRDQARNIDLNTSQRHSLCPAGDNDWVSFVATPDKVYTMETLNLTPSVDTVITLFDAQGNFLFENDDYQPGSGLHSRIDWSFQQTGVYFLRIRDKRGAGGTGFEYTVRLSSVGSLPPTATSTPSPTFNPNSPTPTPAPCLDAYESNGLPSSAKPILIGTAQRHSICPAADADWVTFYALAGKVYTIRTSNLGPGLDTFMYVFDTNGTTILAQNDDGGEGVASRIDFFPLRNDWYYAQIKNAGDIGGPQQTYDLSLAVVPGAPQPPSTASPVIAPPITVTTAPPPPTGQPQATRPPAPSPTQGQVQPTPPAQEQPPPPVQTSQVPPQPPLPVQTGQPVPPEVPGEPSATMSVPNVPRTGAQDSAAEGPVELPNTGKPQAGPALSPLMFKLFYDASGDGKWARAEGIRGVHAYVVSDGGTKSAVVTGDGGICEALLPQGTYRLVIPYFGIDVPLVVRTEFRLAPVPLPDRVP
jgi:hypothetical protein